LIAACTAEPFMIAGTGRFDTDVQALFGARLFVKGGAEGVHCAAFPDLGLGVAVKCDDGAGRAAEVVTAAVIAAFLAPTDAEQSALRPRLRPAILTRAGAPAGEIRPAKELLAALPVS
jgi:L-asparaginase II